MPVVSGRHRLITLAKDKGIWDPTVPGPAFYDPERDGVTFSLLSGWRQCRELARLNLRGVTSRGSSMALIYGTLIHAALQVIYESTRMQKLHAVPSRELVGKVLNELDATFRKENPRASAETMQYAEFSMALASATLPFYFSYWKSDFTDVKWRAVEGEFKIRRMFTLANGRRVSTFIRGKMDGVFDERKFLRLFETKTKTRIEEGAIADVLTLDLQVKIYLWAMKHIFQETPHGVRYNIIRRPGLRQKKGESLAQFAVRCAEDIKARPDFYFIRMDMDVSQHDMDAFEGELDDLVSDFLGWWYGVVGHYRNSGNCENKYGTCQMLRICGPDRDFSRFHIRKTVFRELEEV